MNKKLVLLAVIILGSGLLTSCFTDSGNKPEPLPNAPEDTKKFTVTFTHKGEKSGRSLTNKLYQLPSPLMNNDELDSDELESQARYFMDVVSVFCGENVCKIDKVRLFWNELGDYHHLELGKGVELEKGNGLDFESDDYVKLDKVLRNKQSGLKLLERHELVSEQIGGNAVDALTGATVSLDKNDYITGAIWTCYTLWHFVNGDIANIIRNYAGDEYTENHFQQFVVNGSANYLQFSLQQLSRKNMTTAETQALITQSALNYLNKSNQKINQSIALQQYYVDYAKALSTINYYSMLSTFVIKGDSELRWLALKSIQASTKIVPSDYFEGLSVELKRFDSYQSIHLFLTILKDKKAFNNNVNSHLVALLKHDNFIVARSVYWALLEQNVSNEVKQTLNAFERTYSAKL
jgi:hypothetical protein